MLNKNGLRMSILGSLLLTMALSVAVTNADGLQDYVLSKLDGKGTVDSINVAAKNIVIDDQLFALSRTTTVFDVKKRRNSSLENIKQGDRVGFKSKPLSKPTAPFDQLIIKMWILPSNS
jgi:hypothetical protein